MIPELQAWMASWCNAPWRGDGARYCPCRKNLECPEDEGRPDCPALAELRPLLAKEMLSVLDSVEGDERWYREVSPTYREYTDSGVVMDEVLEEVREKVDDILKEIGGSVEIRADAGEAGQSAGEYLPPSGEKRGER